MHCMCFSISFSVSTRYTFICDTHIFVSHARNRFVCRLLFNCLSAICVCVCATIVHSRRLRRIHSIKCSKLVSDIATHRTRQLVGHESNKFIYDSEFLRFDIDANIRKLLCSKTLLRLYKTNSRSINQFICNEIMIIDVAFSFCFLCRAPRYHGTNFHSSTHINNIIWYCLNSSIDPYASACVYVSSSVLVYCVLWPKQRCRWWFQDWIICL